jgi:mono/diheme cytochrome c family protein
MLVALAFFSTDAAFALPWDIDMYRQQSFQAWEMPRAPVKGTVPMGYKPVTMTADEMDEKLKNPSQANFHSVWRGKRLYDVNCYTCHGTTGDGKGPVGKTGALPVPNLLDAFYMNRSDGRIFAVIHYGGAAMPRYGYKFSEQEHWDIVNYVRFLQGKVKVSGMELPK